MGFREKLGHDQVMGVCSVLGSQSPAKQGTMRSTPLALIPSQSDMMLVPNECQWVKAVAALGSFPVWPVPRMPSPSRQLLETTSHFSSVACLAARLDVHMMRTIWTLWW